jgi:hypothetical protein
VTPPPDVQMFERLSGRLARLEAAVGDLAESLHGITNGDRLAAQHPELAELNAERRARRGDPTPTPTPAPR